MALRWDGARKHTHRQRRVLHLVRIRHYVEQGHRTVSTSIVNVLINVANKANESGINPEP